MSCTSTHSRNQATRFYCNCEVYEFSTTDVYVLVGLSHKSTNQVKFLDKEACESINYKSIKHVGMNVNY